jgi:hypothetical protein
VAWLVAHPEAGDVIAGSGGCRKVRWSRPGIGKRGGVRVIHYNRLSDGVIYLLLIYAKNVRDDIDAKTLNKVRRTINGKDD